jgi:hypothetical protein
VNGIGVDYSYCLNPSGPSDSRVSMSSGSYFGDNDNPTSHQLDLSGRRVVRVAIQFGSLIDSITFTLSDSSIHKFGSAGGDKIKCVDIPDGSKLVGFYGGDYMFCKLENI